MRTERNSNGTPTHVGGALRDLLIARIRGAKPYKLLNEVCAAVEEWLRENPNGAVMVIREGDRQGIRVICGATTYSLPPMSDEFPIEVRQKIIRHTALLQDVANVGDGARDGNGNPIRLHPQPPRILWQRR